MYTSSRCKAKHQDYDGFVSKFGDKRTTDDCYTPESIYSAVRDWAVRRYNLGGCRIVRPFWPGEDYQARTLPKYELPPNVMTAANLKGLARLGVPLKVPAAEGILITALDAQRAARKKLYGGGILISDRAAKMAQERSDEAREAIRAARAAKGKADAVWTLSDREKQIIASMEMAD